MSGVGGFSSCADLVAVPNGQLLYRRALEHVACAQNSACAKIIGTCSFQLVIVPKKYIPPLLTMRLRGRQKNCGASVVV